MNVKAALTMALCAFAPLFVAGGAAAQPPASGERAITVSAIAGVISPGAEWQRVWHGTDNADGIVGTPDGGLLFAQEQPNRVLELRPDGTVSVYLTNTLGAGSLSVDADGRLLGVERACTDPGRPAGTPCRQRTRVSVLSPERAVLADRFENGEALGRLNDLVADRRGGAYFTVGGAFYVDRDGTVSAVAEDIRANGIMLSPDEDVLYVTNRDVVVAFDVRADGSVANRRDFAELAGDDGADGMAIDSAGRLYVTANAGVHVLDEEGRHLGLIPTPRRPISVAFSGSDKRTLYVVGSGAVAADGDEYTTPEGVRNNAKTIYRISMLAKGFEGRPK